MDRFEFINSETDGSGTISLNATEPISQITYEVEGQLTTSGQMLSDSEFTFSNSFNSASSNSQQITVNNEKVSRISINSQGGEPELIISSNVVNQMTYNGSKAKDSITIEEETLTKKNSTFNLGKKPDDITFLGELKKTTVDLGDDKAVDRVTLNSTDQITAKRLRINNFSKRDELVIDGETFLYADLKEERPEGIKIGFKNDSSLSRVVDDDSHDLQLG